MTSVSLPIIAIVGRPNVGKSTLFNRLIGQRKSITFEQPGTTRDRVYGEMRLKNQDVILVDTGGLTFETGESLEADIQKQVTLAIDEADLIYFLTDASEELTGIDFRAASLLRKTKKPVVLIGNKSDRKTVETSKNNLYELGVGDVILISGYHGRGLDELEKTTRKILKKIAQPALRRKKKENIIHLAIIGRPNVGKSSLVNALLGEERVIVSEKPGTTVDATDTLLTYEDQKFNLIDTAGIRRRGKIQKGIEKLSWFRALQAISRSDVSILLLDASEKVAQQDCHISEFVLEAGKGLILAVNKCDLMDDHKKDEDAMIRLLRYKMDYVPWAPVIFLSAMTKKHIFYIFEIARKVIEERSRKIPDETFRHFLSRTVIKHLPPSIGSKMIKIYGGRQIKTNPPVFLIETNFPDNIHFSYRRYLENELRKTFGFDGTAMWIDYRKPSIKSSSARARHFSATSLR